MRNKKSSIVVFTSIALGLLGASLAQASERESGGYKIGPLGQVLGAPTEWRAAPESSGRTAYGFVSRGSQRAQVRSGHVQSSRGEETYIGVQDLFYRESNGE
jgi:hypothetical protein